VQVYISADIEGVAGIGHWDETHKSKGDYPPFRDQMQAEVNAACEGALAAGATHIRVKDAHATGRNLDGCALPRPTELVRGWSGHPLLMVQELDEGYDALAFVGYHDRAGSGANPLAHTITDRINEMRINGEPVAEFHLHAMCGASLGVPAVFVAGDASLCARVALYDQRIITVPTNIGRGESVLAPHPAAVVEAIREGMEAACRAAADMTCVPLAERFVLEVDYKLPGRAYRGSWYPGAQLVSDHLVAFETDTWFEVMRALRFIL